MIVFNVPSVTTSIGSVRYRALLPALFLRRGGRETRVISGFDRELINACEVAVFVKSFGKADLQACIDLRLRGARIYLDLCDNIFVDGYADDKGIASRALVMSKLADGVITTNEAMVEELSQWCPDSHFVIVPDPLETIELLREAEGLDRPNVDATDADVLSQRHRLLRKLRSSAFKTALKKVIGGAARVWLMMFNPYRTMREISRFGHLKLQRFGRQIPSYSRKLIRVVYSALRKYVRRLPGYSRKFVRVVYSTLRKYVRRLPGYSRKFVRVVYSTLRKYVRRLPGYSRKLIRVVYSTLRKYVRRLPDYSRKLIHQARKAAIRPIFTVLRFVVVGILKLILASADCLPSTIKSMAISSVERTLSQRLRGDLHRLAHTDLFGARIQTPSKSENAATKPNGISAVVENSDCIDNLDRTKKTILWFGNHGADHSNYGMLTLLSVMPELTKISRLMPIQLLVVSNNITKFNRFFAEAPFDVQYVEWDPYKLYDIFSISDVCLIPNTLDKFSRGKSANRAVSALHHGVPVVATRVQSLELLGDCLIFDDWEKGIVNYLTDNMRRRRDVAVAQEIIEQNYSEFAIKNLWEMEILNRETAHPPLTHPQRSCAMRLMVVFAMEQDTDLLLPVVKEGLKDPRFEAKVIVEASLAYSSPRTIRELRDSGIAIRFADKTQIASGKILERIEPDVVLTASETSASPHRSVHSLVRLANRMDIRTFTLQHGVENIGLSYFDEIHGRDVTFASQKILVWCDPNEFPKQIPDATKRKCIFVGCPKEEARDTERDAFPLKDKQFVAIFENLHWHRYTDAYRALFLKMIDDLVAEFQNISFVVKPHPAGRWLTERNRGAHAKEAPNLIIADPKLDLWEPFPAAAFLRGAAAVITTPSTIAFDAARNGSPVAVVSGELDLQVYQRLPWIKSPADAIAFVENAINMQKPSQSSIDFAARWTGSENAVNAILDSMIS